jgi:hypothetical protein
VWSNQAKGKEQQGAKYGPYRFRPSEWTNDHTHGGQAGNAPGNGVFCHSVAVFGWQAGFYQPTRQAQENYLGDVCPGQSEAPSEKADFRRVLFSRGSAQCKAFSVVGSVKGYASKALLTETAWSQSICP